MRDRKGGQGTENLGTDGTFTYFLYRIRKKTGERPACPRVFLSPSFLRAYTASRPKTGLLIPSDCVPNLRWRRVESRRMKPKAVVVISLLLLTVLPLVGQQMDPGLRGDWNLNVGKSTFGPGPAPK